GGFPGPQFGENGALYVMDTGSGQLTKVNVSADQADPQARNSQSGYWQQVFWQDTTHLLAWYNGASSNSNQNAGLYRYNLATKTLNPVLFLKDLGVTTLFGTDTEKGLPLLLSTRYGQGNLYYQEVLHPYTAQSE